MPAPSAAVARSGMQCWLPPAAASHPHYCLLPPSCACPSYQFGSCPALQASAMPAPGLHGVTCAASHCFIQHLPLCLPAGPPSAPGRVLPAPLPALLSSNSLCRRRALHTCRRPHRRESAPATALHASERLMETSSQPLAAPATAAAWRKVPDSADACDHSTSHGCWHVCDSSASSTHWLATAVSCKRADACALHPLPVHAPPTCGHSHSAST